MRFFLFILGCLATCFATVHANSFYVRGSAGANFIDNEKDCDIDPGYYIGGSLGYRFSRFFRLEGEGIFRHNNIHLNKLWDMEAVVILCELQAPIRTWTAMGNAFVDLPCHSFLFPFIGGGIGALWVNSTGKIFVGNEIEGYVLKCKIADHCFAYQGIAGLGVPLGQWGALTVDYRYLNGEDSPANHSVGMSLMCQF